MKNIIDELMWLIKTKFAKMVSFLALAGAAIIFSGGCKLLAGQDLDILNCDDASFINYVMSNTPYQEMFDVLSDENLMNMVKEKLKDEKIMNLVNEYLKNSGSGKILPKDINFNGDQDLSLIINILGKK